MDSLTLGSTSYEYEYDVNGLRTRKVDQTGKKTEYFIVDGLTVGHRVTNANGTVSYTMRYYFDEKNSPVGYGIQYGNSTYWQNFYFAKNAQGDVVALYRTNYNSSTQQNYGTLVCTYKYDPYGALLGVYDANGNATNDYDANLNPFRYRGYYYDTESRFYYLQSRYYDPSIGRFINADEYADTDSGVLGYNMYAYCLNNPVNRSDASGTFSLPNWAKVAIGVAVIATAAAVTVSTAGAAGSVMAAVNCAAHGALMGSIAQSAMGAVTGAITGAVTNRITTGSWKGSGQAMLDGAATGFMSGAISGAVTGAINSPYCFVAGTTVLAAAGVVVIESIEAGDLVWTWDEETGEVSLKGVVETYINETDELVHIHVGGEEIITTPSHPFYSPIKGWTDAAKLRAGDILVLVNGEYVVVEKVQHEILEAPVPVYNFQVEDFHTYYVADAGVLVHNSCGNKGANATNAPKNLSPDGAKRTGAFRQAKRDLGIPTSQQPQRILPNINRQGKIVPGRVYDFGNGRFIRDDIVGHVFSDGTVLGPHFNTPTKGHYFYVS